MMISLVLGEHALATNLPAAFVCEFATGFFSAPESGRFVTSETHDTLRLTFASIDPKRGTAQMIGNAGAADVMLVVGLNAVHFVEITGAGNVTLTTVDDTTTHPNGRFFAAHSRHIASLTELLVSQDFGSCEGKWP
jgi:hypothetical protein